MITYTRLPQLFSIEDAATPAALLPLMLQCYSGFGPGLNNPAMESVRNIGPIPAGEYQLRCWTDLYPSKGPCVAILRPCDSTYDREGFLIHGDNKQLNHTASHGCIIAPRLLREWLRASGQMMLRVG